MTSTSLTSSTTAPTPSRDAMPGSATHPSVRAPRMTHDEELEFASRLQALRRELLAIALLDPASSAELARVAADVDARTQRIEAVVDEPEHSPAEVTQRFEAFRQAVAHLHDRNALTSTALAASAGEANGEDEQTLAPALDRALQKSLAIAASTTLQWDCVERLLQETWVGGASGAPSRAPASTVPRALAERALRLQREVDAIVERFVTSNQGLVSNVVQRYRGLGLSRQDLMQDGNIGLLRAVEKFDTRRGKPFGSYAVWWVRDAVRRALATQARTIRLPVHALATHYALGQAERRLAHELGRDPSQQELSKATGVAPESIADVMRMSREPLSLDAPKADDTEVTLGDALADRRAPSPNEHTSAKERSDHLQMLLAGLSPRERHVLRLRFGLDGDEEHTLEEIGRSLDLTRERVRQILAGALDQLQRTTRARRLEL